VDSLNHSPNSSCKQRELVVRTFHPLFQSDCVKLNVFVYICKKNNWAIK